MHFCLINPKHIGRAKMDDKNKEDRERKGSEGISGQEILKELYENR